jgi:suppressor of cytokine signaling 2
MAPSSGFISKKLTQFPEIANWLENATGTSFEIEHPVEHEHQNWASEPELWLYNPGILPHRRIRRFKRNHSIDSQSSTHSRNLSGRKISRMSALARLKRLKLTRHPSCSKSDGYHRKYVWDMVFRERADIAINEGKRHFKKLKNMKKLATRHGSGRNASRRSNVQSSLMSSSEDCISGVSGQRRPMPMSAAAAQFNNIQLGHFLNATSTQLFPTIPESGRKISQTGSGIFGKADERYEAIKNRTGRHQAFSENGTDEISPKKRHSSSRKSPTQQFPIQSQFQHLQLNSGNFSGNSMFPNFPYIDPLMMQSLMMQGYHSMSPGYPMYPNPFYPSGHFIPQKSSQLFQNLPSEKTPETGELRRNRRGFTVSTNNTHNSKSQDGRDQDNNNMNDVASPQMSNKWESSKSNSTPTTKSNSTAMTKKTIQNRFNRIQEHHSRESFERNVMRPGNNSVSDYVEQLKKCVDTLNESGFYWGNLTGEMGMKVVLANGIGSFLVRDSSHKQYLFTLTVNTSGGVTNVRIVYSHGLFSLDCEASDTSAKFDCVLKMISYYVSNSKKYQRMKTKKKSMNSSSDSAPMNSGSENSNSVALLLLKPCRKQMLTLFQSARIALNKKLSRKKAKEQGITIENIVKDDAVLDKCKKYPYII